jgi:hypothetical protein
MMAFTESLAAYVASQFIVFTPFDWVEVALVVRTHMVHQIRSHPETGIALGTPVL